MQNVYFIKQGQCSILREMRFVKPEFAKMVPSLMHDNEALYQDPDTFGIKRENQEIKLLEIAKLGVSKYFGDQDILQDVSKGEKKAPGDENKGEGEGANA